MRRPVCPAAPFRVRAFSPQPASLAGLGIGPYPLEDRVRQLVARPAPAGWKPTGLTAVSYLDMMEHLVRYTCANWMNPDGTLNNRLTGRAAAPFRLLPGAAVLLAHGRVSDLEPLVLAAMTRACEAMREPARKGKGFLICELAAAYPFLKDRADPATRAAWTRALSEFVPDQTYDMDKLHNWMVYAASGEYMRARLGLRPRKPCLSGEAFFDTHMAFHLKNLSPLGMYCDPGDPITYDITTRLKFATALAFGYRGRLKKPLEEFLRRGGLTTLLMMAPDGYAPYGGRSDQSNFQEAMVAALCELEARRYARSDPRLAGAFKRQAHVSAAAIRRWVLDRVPPKDIKNGFPPEARHGYDSYRVDAWQGDLTFVSAILALAVLFADESVREAPCPAEQGGFVLHLDPSFRKIIANSAGHYMEIDTAAELTYNATGLGRFLRRGVPLELGLGLPFAMKRLRWGQPGVSMAEKLFPDVDVAIGPRWLEKGQWQSLAGRAGSLEHHLHVFRESPETCHFLVVYKDRSDYTEIREEYRLTARGLEIRTRVQLKEGWPARIGFTVPLLVTDGQDRSEIEPLRAGRARVRYQGFTYEARYGRAVTATLAPREMGNRNGVYRTLELETGDCEIAVRLSLTSCEGTEA